VVLMKATARSISWDSAMAAQRWGRKGLGAAGD
jgi:hypothetical protein